jgi:hypothetical protein
LKKQRYSIIIAAFLFTILFSAYTNNSLEVKAQDNILADSGTPPPSTPTPLADFMVSASAGPGGTITPSGDMFTTPGESHSFTITPDVGYQILDVKDNGVSKGAISSYSIPNIHENHQVEATFVASTENNSIIIIAAIAIVIVIVAIAAALIIFKRRKK